MHTYDVLVIGGGHAGCEAAFAAARMGADTLLVTGSLDRIATLPCNCSVGGPAKGHLVREIDALGGAMARITDATLTHLRMLNTGKGPAVRALRAQVDVQEYPAAMRTFLKNVPNLQMHEALVEELIVENGLLLGVRTTNGEAFAARAVVVTTGTFLRGLCHMGEKQWEAGRGIPSVGTVETAAYGLSRLSNRARFSARTPENRDDTAYRSGFRSIFPAPRRSQAIRTRPRSRSVPRHAATTDCCRPG